MAQPDSSLTPEQRLLKLIEEPQQSEAQGPGQNQAKRGRPISLAELLSPASIQGLVKQVTEFVKGRLKGSDQAFSFKQIIWLVRIAAIVIFVYLALNLMWEYASLDRNMKSITMVKQQERTEAPSTAVKNFGSLDDEAKRNVFVPVEKTETKKESGSASLALIELTKDLKLTGISVDPDNPERTFCMIEDIKKNVTTFLKKGDSISGMKVGDISSDEVTLLYNDEKIQLR